METIPPSAFEAGIRGLRDSPLIWLGSMPGTIAGSLARIARLFEFYTANARAWAMLDRRDGSLWLAGEPDAAGEIVEGVPWDRLWIDAASTEAAAWCGALDAAAQVHHLRLACEPGPRVPNTGRVGLAEIESLRAVDVEQYGRALDAVVDYPALLRNGEVFGAWARERLVATALLAEAAPGISTVSSVWTRRAVRRRGHASVLMQGLLRELAPGTCALNVDAKNAPALALYMGLGFRRTGALVSLVRT